MPGYLVKHERIAITGAADLRIRSLLDNQQFHDPDGSAAAQGISSAQWPLFGLLWASGMHLADAVASRPLLAGERILEIGCGLALASLVCHRRGAQVTASDCHPLAQGFLEENLRLNGLRPMAYRHGRWGATAGMAAPAARRVGGRFGLIMGSDVLYERDEAGMLARFIGRHATAAGEVMIVDPNRGNRGPFHRRMAALGYEREETMLGGLQRDGSPYRGRLLHYRRAV